MSQRDRVLAALRNSGLRGITQVDFLRFPTIDGGAPITRVAARVQELRGAGHKISSSDTRDKCAVYRLVEAGLVVSDASAPGGPAGHADGDSVAGVSETTSLFDPNRLEQPKGAYDDVWDDAA